jgi:hypothetical protein
MVTAGIGLHLAISMRFLQASQWVRTELVLGLGLAVVALILLEQVFRNVTDDARWNVKPLCLALLGQFGFDQQGLGDVLQFLAEGLGQIVGGKDLLVLDDRSHAFLKRLLDAPGPSGFEQVPARLWRDEARSFATVDVDVGGNSIATINPKGTPRVMLAGHVDEIGVMVVHVDDDGFVPLNSVTYYNYQYKRRDNGALARVGVPALFAGALYRADQRSFLLYPERALPAFLDRNVIPGTSVEAVPQKSVEIPIQSDVREPLSFVHRFAWVSVTGTTRSTTRAAAPPTTASRRCSRTRGPRPRWTSWSN